MHHVCLLNIGFAVFFDRWSSVSLENRCIDFVEFHHANKTFPIILLISHTQTINKHEAIHNPERSANSVGNSIVRSVNIRTVHPCKLIHKYILSTMNLAKSKHQYYIDGSVTVVLVCPLPTHWRYQSCTKPLMWWRLNKYNSPCS